MYSSLTIFSDKSSFATCFDENPISPHTRAFALCKICHIKNLSILRDFFVLFFIKIYLFGEVEIILNQSSIFSDEISNNSKGKEYRSNREKGS